MGCGSLDLRCSVLRMWNWNFRFATWMCNLDLKSEISYLGILDLKVWLLELDLGSSTLDLKC